MFIGHFAVGLGAKKLAPEINLGILFIACQLLDLIWPVFVLLGIEIVSVDYFATEVTPLNFEYYPYSHSLVMTLIYGLSAGAIAGLFFMSKRIGIIIGVVTGSHWLLDFISHRADLPILLDGPKAGLGLWNSLPTTVATELILFATGIILYLKSPAHPTQKQKIGFWALIVFLLLVYVANVFGPKPPVNTSAVTIAGPALSMWLIVLWGYFVDKKTA